MPRPGGPCLASRCLMAREPSAESAILSKLEKCRISYAAINESTPVSIHPAFIPVRSYDRFAVSKGLVWNCESVCIRAGPDLAVDKLAIEIGEDRALERPDHNPDAVVLVVT